TVEELARFLALVNVAMADAGISAWEAKYHYLYPRPVTFIRTTDLDQTDEGKADPRWTPLGAPVTNGRADARNLTPPFPSYPSGHATFGGALFETFRKYWAVQNDAGTAFKFLSDEYNGENYGPGDMTARPKKEVEFTDFGSAEDANGESRIYLGIHWVFDKT